MLWREVGRCATLLDTLTPNSIIMKSFLSSLIALVCLAASLQSLPKKRTPMDSCMQLVVVTTNDWNSSQATLRRYWRANIRMPWQEKGEPITVVVGKNGLAWGKGAILVDKEVGTPDDPVKKEGDGRAPAGIFWLGTTFGYTTQPMPGWKMPYRYLNSAVECVDDTKSKFYNQIVDRSTVAPDWNSSEHMLRQDDLYRWGVLVEHNYGSAQPGGGSCIFMHIWRGPGQPTVGCTAMPQVDLESLIAWLDPGRTPMLVQLPIGDYEKLRHGWRLPVIKNANEKELKSVGKR
jgi:L,D-peptidoglycan transpeptidase YkuD (ErfK/YbiS/YcfS/YnhG family)